MRSLLLGEAYGFFNCWAPKEIIKTELPGIVERSMSRGLEIALMSMEEFCKNIDKPLARLIAETEVHPIVPAGYTGQINPVPMVDLKYVMKASSVGIDNEMVADELGMVLNSVYQSYFDRAGFYALIAWKKNDVWVLSA